MSYQSEIKVLIGRGLAKRLRKYIGNCGFITHVLEVSDKPIGEVDQFRIVIYHESLKEYICEKTGYKIEQWENRAS